MSALPVEATRPEPQWVTEYREHLNAEIVWKDAPQNRYVAIIPFLFTTAIVCGSHDDLVGYDDRWCYEDFASAFKAFNSWDGVHGEPAGWHRHPMSGRRRPHGDAGLEHVNP